MSEEIKKDEYIALTPICINSKWCAKFLADDREYCQCPFECKVKVMHRPTQQKFVVNEEEYNKIFN